MLSRCIYFTYSSDSSQCLFIVNREEGYISTFVLLLTIYVCFMLSQCSCRMEARYANQLLKKNKLKLLFVMMDQQYTTTSMPDYIDGT